MFSKETSRGQALTWLNKIFAGGFSVPHLAKADAGMCILIAPRMLDIGKHDPLHDHVGCLGGICI